MGLIFRLLSLLPHAIMSVRRTWNVVPRSSLIKGIWSRACRPAYELPMLSTLLLPECMLVIQIIGRVISEAPPISTGSTSDVRFWLIRQKSSAAGDRHFTHTLRLLISDVVKNEGGCHGEGICPITSQGSASFPLYSIGGRATSSPRISAELRLACVRYSDLPCIALYRPYRVHCRGRLRQLISSAMCFGPTSEMAVQSREV